MTTTDTPEFPVQWSEPADAGLTWRQSKMHWPEPVRRLSFDLGSAVLSLGMGRADIILRRPTVRRSGLFNGYVYGTQTPVVAANAVERDRESRALTEAIGRDAMAQWREVLPEVEQHLVALERFDRRALANDLLLALELGVVRGQRLWEIHSTLVGSSLIAIEQYLQLYNDLFPGDGELAAMRLLEGEQTKTIEAAEALATLARELAMDEAVRQLITGTEADALAGALAAIPAAWEKVHAYLDVFGRRTVTADPALPGLIEDPTLVLRELRAHVLDPARDPVGDRQRAVAERDQRVAAVVDRLHGYPRAVLDALRTWLHAARGSTALMETHNFYIDFGFAYRIRLIALALGTRIAEAGLIQYADDVFDLTLDELRATVVGSIDRKALVRERLAELAAQRRLRPPAIIGAAPRPVSSAEALVNLQLRASARFTGTPIAQTDDPRLVRGRAGSSGMAHGIARVIRTIAEAHRVGAGEILVTPTTSSPWTLLFARVAAVVTDTGGSLSHCAIVAREYRIPAVVGCGDACARIPDGALIEVDGDAGEVRLLDNGADR